MNHGTKAVEEKVRELRNLTIDEIAEAILTLEIQLDDACAKLDGASAELEAVRE